ncbi:hypothetical protein [Amycolatopsis sp. NPDC001319]|uniref:hypothetical protein n=1 Tax=unclassified Amycolatopsis TaxID=2618356 RepID=UPI0036CA4E0B
MTAVVEREHVVLGGDPVLLPLVETVAGRAEWAAASLAAQQPEQCRWCQHEGHTVRWHVYPHPGENPAEGVLDELVSACFCCIWGPRGLLDRAERESVDDRPIEVEHCDRDGRWAHFERWI